MPLKHRILVFPEALTTVQPDVAAAEESLDAWVNEGWEIRAVTSDRATLVVVLQREQAAD